MLGFQASIGATNDLVDLPRDALRESRKPLPAGQVTVGLARSVAVVGGVVGLGLSATLGIQVLAGRRAPGTAAASATTCGSGPAAWRGWPSRPRSPCSWCTPGWVPPGRCRRRGRCCCRWPRRSARRSTCPTRSSTWTPMPPTLLVGWPAGSVGERSLAGAARCSWPSSTGSPGSSWCRRRCAGRWAWTPRRGGHIAVCDRACSRPRCWPCSGSDSRPAAARRRRDRRLGGPGARDRAARGGVGRVGPA